MRNTFRKQERLKRKNLIANLFASGESTSVFPLKVIYLAYEHESPYKIQAGVSVSKRNFKKAVDRNRIKRLMRESYRKNKHLIYNNEDTKKHIIMFIYQTSDKISYEQMELKMKQLIHKFLQKQKPGVL
jgi:ribonuclease P protein component